MSTKPASLRRDELDEVTLRRAQRGDQAACRALVERYQRPVFALLSRMMPAGDGADDIAQETFLEVFRSLARFSPLGSARLSTWILTIASRRAVDELRRRPPMAPEALTADITAPSRADERAIRRGVGEAIEREVRQLSPEHRAAFLLREYHGFEYAEIARALAVDVGTVKSRLSRARAVLREKLAQVRDD